MIGPVYGRYRLLFDGIEVPLHELLTAHAPPACIGDQLITHYRHPNGAVEMVVRSMRVVNRWRLRRQLARAIWSATDAGGPPGPRAAAGGLAAPTPTAATDVRTGHLCQGAPDAVEACPAPEEATGPTTPDLMNRPALIGAGHWGVRSKSAGRRGAGPSGEGSSPSAPTRIRR